MKPIKGSLRVTLVRVDTDPTGAGDHRLTLRGELCDEEGTPLARFMEVTLPAGAAYSLAPVWLVPGLGDSPATITFRPVTDPDVIEDRVDPPGPEGVAE